MGLYISNKTEAPIGTKYSSQQYSLYSIFDGTKQSFLCEILFPYGNILFYLPQKYGLDQIIPPCSGGDVNIPKTGFRQSVISRVKSKIALWLVIL